jgi:hypothetical protein
VCRVSCVECTLSVSCVCVVSVVCVVCVVCACVYDSGSESFLALALVLFTLLQCCVLCV